MEPETAAFGYLRERLHSEQRAARSDLWLSRDMRRIGNGERRSRSSKALTGAFVPLGSRRRSIWARKRTALGTISKTARLVHGYEGRDKMRNEYLAAVVIAALVACTGLVANSLRSLPSEKQSAPNTQVADRLAASVDPFLLRSGG